MNFRKNIGFESQYLLSWRFLAVIIVFFLVCGYFIQYGIAQYKHIMREKENFQRFEDAKLLIFVYLSQYGDYGLRLLFVPSPLMAFFDGGPVPNLMTAFIDTSERMNIYQPLKSQNAFTRFNNLFMNFGGFILLFGSIIVLFYGYDSFRRHVWLKFLESVFKSRKKLYFFIIASRVALLFLICLILGAISMLLFIINGVSINHGKILDLKEIDKKYIYKFNSDDSKDNRCLILIEIVRGLSMMEKIEIVIFDNFLAGISDKGIMQFAKFLKSIKEGRKIIYRTNSILINTIIGDSDPDAFFRFKDEELPIS